MLVEMQIWINAQFPYWRRKGGRDHLFVSYRPCHMADTSGRDGTAEWGETWGRARNSTLIDSGPTPSPCRLALGCPFKPGSPAAPMQVTPHDQGSCWMPEAIKNATILSYWGRRDGNHSSFHRECEYGRIPACFFAMHTTLGLVPAPQPADPAGVAWARAQAEDASHVVVAGTAWPCSTPTSTCMVPVERWKLPGRACMACAIGSSGGPSPPPATPFTQTPVGPDARLTLPLRARITVHPTMLWSAGYFDYYENYTHPLYEPKGLRSKISHQPCYNPEKGEIV